MPLQPRVDRFALQRQDREHALVDAAQGLARHEALEAFMAESEFAQGEVALAGQASGAQAFEVFGRVVFGAVDDAQIFRSPVDIQIVTNCEQDVGSSSD